MSLLVPGIGAQGGDVEAAVLAGMNSDKSGLVVNASRSVLYASRGSDFEAAARAAVVSLRNEINRVRGVDL
jgi:orotidine-5'-phosphate decarboxylase